MPTMSVRDLAGRLWRIGVVRGITALALGGYVLSQSAPSPTAVARASAVYWIVDGFIALWAAAFAATLTLSRTLCVLRGGVAIVAGLTLFGLPLAIVFGPWHPGQVLLLVVVSGVMLAVIGAQMAAAILDVMMCLEVRRRIPGEWSCALGAVLSAALAVIAGATLAAPATVLGRALGAGAVIGGLGLLATSATLRSTPEPAPLPAYPNKR